MWEIFEVNTKEEADLLISALNSHKSSDYDMREDNNPEKVEEHRIIDDLIERLS